MAAAVWPSSWPRSSSLRWLNSRSRSPAAWEANSAPSPGAPYLHRDSREGLDQWAETCLQKMTIASGLRLLDPIAFIYIRWSKYTHNFYFNLIKNFSLHLFSKHVTWNDWAFPFSPFDLFKIHHETSAVGHLISLAVCWRNLAKMPNMISWRFNAINKQRKGVWPELISYGSVLLNMCTVNNRCSVMNGLTNTGNKKPPKDKQHF